jgi:hypothetical protein
MTPENFTYWLKGYLELSRVGTVEYNISLDSIQVKMIEEHLDLVFNKVTPNHSRQYCGLDTKFTGISSDLLC